MGRSRRRGRGGAAVALAVLVALPGCTNGPSTGESTAPTATTVAATGAPTGAEPTAPAAPDASAVLDLFVAAAGSGDARAMWELLSTPARKRVGGSLGAFRSGVATELSEGVGTLAGARYETILALEPTPGWAVVAITGRRTAEGKTESAAFATALRDEGGVWKVELGGPVRIDPLLPAGGVHPGESPQLGVRVEAGAAITDGGVWIDGQPLPALAAGPDDRHKLIAGETPEPLAAGTHVGVAFARAGHAAAARAWTFVAE